MRDGSEHARAARGSREESKGTVGHDWHAAASPFDTNCHTLFDNQNFFSSNCHLNISTNIEQLINHHAINTLIVRFLHSKINVSLFLPFFRRLIHVFIFLLFPVLSFGVFVSNVSDTWYVLNVVIAVVFVALVLASIFVFVLVLILVLVLIPDTISVFVFEYLPG